MLCHKWTDDGGVDDSGAVVLHRQETPDEKGTLWGRGTDPAGHNQLQLALAAYVNLKEVLL